MEKGIHYQFMYCIDYFPIVYFQMYLSIHIPMQAYLCIK